MVEMDNERKGLDITISYPYSPDYYYETILERINLDTEREQDILSGKGFIVSSPKGIIKDIKDPNGIFSPKFGQTLSDLNPFIDRYKCECGALRSRIHFGIVCKYCGTPVKYVDDDYSFFGWLVLKKHYIIHPNLYKTIEALIGYQRLINIICIEELIDKDGHPNKKTKKKERGKLEPFYGIGMIEFKERFKEIIDYYYQKSVNKASKKGYYEEIIRDMDKVFCQSIPVFTTHLRPFDVSDKRDFKFEGTNGIYNMMSKLVAVINNDSLKIFRKKKEKNQALYDLQMKYNELYDEIDNILSGKKGNIRQLAGGRYNFSSRNVIVQNPKLRIDQVTLPYKCLVELLQQQIINVLQKSYNMSYNDAYTIWYKANIEKDELVVQIIKGLMFANPMGLPIILNRNPTIARGGILQVFCVGMTDTYTMGIPLQILKLLAADFDGDVLNIFYIINKAFYTRAFQVLNPRNSMYISNNDGKLNMDVVHQRDTIINANTLVRLGRKNYSEEQLAKIKMLKAKYS